MTYSWSWSTVSLFYVGLARASNVWCPRLLHASPQPLEVQQQGPPARLSRVCTPRPAPWCDCMGNPSSDAAMQPQAKPSFLAIWAKLPLGAGTPLIAQDFYHFQRQRTENWQNHKYKHLGSFIFLCCYVVRTAAGTAVFGFTSRLESRFL